MLRIDERGGAAVPLRGSDDGQRQRGLTGGLGPEYLDHPAARHSADTERDVEAERAGRYRFDLVGCARVAETHHRAFAKLFFDLAQRGSESFLAIFFHGESLTKRGAIISHPARAAHLICIETTEFYCEFTSLSSSDQEATTV